MELISVKTRVLMPPQDDLYTSLQEVLPQLREGDVLAVSSKVIAIHEGRCVPIAGTDKAALITEEADLLIPRTYWSSPLTITRSAFIGTAGIDESNANDYYVLLPEDAFLSAKKLHTFLRDTYGISELGVIITDSHSSPLRRGAVGVSIGFYGFKPTINHVGEPDLFGRPMQIEVSNLVDGLAAAANVVMGETNASIPAVLMRGVPDVSFTDKDCKEEAYVSFEEDTFRVLYERFIKPNDSV